MNVNIYYQEPYATNNADLWVGAHSTNYHYVQNGVDDEAIPGEFTQTVVKTANAANVMCLIITCSQS